MYQDTKKDNRIIRFAAVNLFIVFASVYILSASGPNFYSTDASQLRLQVVKSIVERADLSVPEGWIGADGRNYSIHGIGSVLLAIPFYYIGKFLGIPEILVSIINHLFGALTAILIFLFSITLGYSRKASLLVSVFYGFGTIAWPLAKHPFDHVIETFFILLSVYLVYLYVVNKRISYLLYSAFSLGFAFITRYISIIVIPPLFIFMIISLQRQSDLKTALKQVARNVILFSIALLPFLGLFLWYNYYRFGSIFETGYQLMADRTGIDFFTGTELFKGLSGFLISPGKGFFFYSPVAILFFFSIKNFIKKHPELGVSFIFILLSYLLFLSKNIFWHGDWSWGPRYILVLTPFFIIPVTELIEISISKKKRSLKIIIYSIFAVSLIIQVVAVSVDFQKYFIQLIYEEKIKFNKVYGYGVLPIVEPPVKIYYDWHKSPILAQFKFSYNIAKGIKHYKYSKPPNDATSAETVKISPYMNIIDFWWVYQYVLERRYYSILEAFSLVLIAIYCGSRIYKHAT